LGLKAKGTRIEIRGVSLVPEAMGIIQSAINGRERAA
jgi:hypothetical protein